MTALRASLRSNEPVPPDLTVEAITSRRFAPLANEEPTVNGAA